MKKVPFHLIRMQVQKVFSKDERWCVLLSICMFLFYFSHFQSFGVAKKS